MDEQTDRQTEQWTERMHKEAAAGIFYTDKFEFLADSPGQVDGVSVDVFDGDQCAAIRADLGEQLTHVDLRV